MIAFNVKNLDKLFAEIKSYPQDIDRIIRDKFQAFVDNTTATAKELAPVDMGKLREGIHGIVDGNELTVGSYVDYAAFVEYGTKKFAAEYVSSLPTEWQDEASQHR